MRTELSLNEEVVGVESPKWAPPQRVMWAFSLQSIRLYIWEETT